MPGVKDIGGGVQIVDTSKPEISALDIAQKQLSLVELASKIQQAPYELAQKQADAILRQNDVANITVSNAMKRAELTAKNDEIHRSRTQDLVNTISSVAGLANQSPEAARAFLQFASPGSAFIEKKDGTYVSVIRRSDGVVSALPLDPNKKITDPTKKAEFEKQWRDEYVSRTEEHSTIADQFENIQKLLPQASGPADMATMIALYNIENPKARITPGALQTAEQSQGLRNMFGNLWDKATTEGAPVFGPADSRVRQSYLRVAKTYYENSVAGAKQYGQALFKSTVDAGYNPQVVMPPRGAISWETFAPKNTSGANQRQPDISPYPTAGPGTRASTPRAVPLSTPDARDQLEDRLNNALNNAIWQR